MSYHELPPTDGFQISITFLTPESKCAMKSFTQLHQTQTRLLPSGSEPTPHKLTWQ